MQTEYDEVAGFCVAFANKTLILNFDVHSSSVFN